MKCKVQRDMKDVKYEVNKIGRAVARGKCPVCGTNMYKILAANDVPADLAAKVAAHKRSHPSKGKKSKSGGKRRTRSRSPRRRRASRK